MHGWGNPLTSIALQSAGDSRSEITTAARAQSSANASIPMAIDIKRLSLRLPMQPTASQVTPLPRLPSLAFARRHRRPTIPSRQTCRARRAGQRAGHPCREMPPFVRRWPLECRVGESPGPRRSRLLQQKRHPNETACARGKRTAGLWFPAGVDRSQKPACVRQHPEAMPLTGQPHSSTRSPAPSFAKTPHRSRRACSARRECPSA